MKILAYTATRANTPTRRAQFIRTLAGKLTAGTDFTWHVWVMEDQPTLNIARNYGCEAALLHTNVGQHVVHNLAYAEAVAGEYNYLLRIDDDCVFATKRWLAKLLAFSASVNDTMVISPKVKGLRNPPDTSLECTVKGKPVRFLLEAIGGVCRLHPVKLLDSYISDVRKPLGSGDATGIAAYCKNKLIPMCYLDTVRVLHATAAQEAADPAYFAAHDLCQHIPYIPTL